jgi:hypothetical protein
MSLQQLADQIESHEFAIQTNVVSGIRQFFRAVAEQAPVHQLCSEIQSKDSARELVIRISKLSRQRVDVRYENPFDTAFATYLWVLQSVHPELARVAAEGIVQAPNCFWSSRLAESLLREPFTVGSGSTVIEQESRTPTDVFATHDAGENQILADLAVSFLYQSEGLLFRGITSSPVSSSWQEDLRTGLSTQIAMYDSSIEVTVKADESGDSVTEVELIAA